MRLGGNPWGVSFMYTVALVSNIVTVRDVLAICITIALQTFLQILPTVFTDRNTKSICKRESRRSQFLRSEVTVHCRTTSTESL